ncbi:DUF4232 domain-containing protein [Actinospica sp. MGRD01-02]|uniref:DUF4232 domain-containing protein n=1 Tax=Actinospica acidithermotolerans TaxID=2828514 RepID=A0A941EC78_9ACTN|nr:DUF4232 domain-containing protein [Actinospica acidithermotolerans]MBR7827695.1 DUF4232 domain-containing protein [Actinospica acidithermotolerans]
MELSRKIAIATLAAAVLGGTAACTGSSTAATGTSSASSAAGNGGTQTGAASSGTSTASASTGGGAGASSTAGNSNTGSATTQAAAGGTAACTGSQIKTTLGREGAAMGHRVEALIFTNTSSQTCTLQGYPGAAIVSGSTVLLNATRTLNGYAGDERQLTSAPLVTLKPGAVASANIEWVIDNGETCAANGTGTLEATPPNTKTTTGLGSQTTGTQGICADFEVHPVVAGTLS